MFLLLQSCLGLTINAPAAEVRFFRPSLPESIQHLEIENLRVGKARIDIVAQRYGTSAAINVLRRQGAVEVSIVK